jgi:hypothetical protein
LLHWRFYCLPLVGFGFIGDGTALARGESFKPGSMRKVRVLVMVVAIALLSAAGMLGMYCNVQ